MGREGQRLAEENYVIPVPSLLSKLRLFLCVVRCAYDDFLTYAFYFSYQGTNVRKGKLEGA